jgi:hypothetical protein
MHPEIKKYWELQGELHTTSTGSIYVTLNNNVPYGFYIMTKNKNDDMLYIYYVDDTYKAAYSEEEMLKVIKMQAFL